MRLFPLFRLIAAFAFLLSSAYSSDIPSTWISYGPDHRLVYETDTLGNRIPDFSRCGYTGGETPLPIVPAKVTLKPVDGDAGKLIQDAIDTVSRLPADANGFRGAVLLRRGSYSIDGEIRISSDGVVLRGEGDGPDGTRLMATGTKQRSLIIVGPRSKSDSMEKKEGSPEVPKLAKSRRAITDAYVPVGATFLRVSNSDGLKIGDPVEVFRPSTGEWIHALGMDQIPQNAAGTVEQWKPGSKNLTFGRKITAIDDKLITLDAPVCCALDQTYGGGELLTGVADDSIRRVGVENLSGDSEFSSPTDESHGWVLINLKAASDSWVRNVTSIHFGYSCVNVGKGSSHITVRDCTCLDPISIMTGGRRYSFAVDGQFTLVLRCHTRNGRHDFVMHSLAAGPNAFVECSSEEAHSDSGPHHRWSVGVLYDNVSIHGSKKRDLSSGQLNIRNRSSSGTGHGWAGANQVLWNCDADSITVEQPPTAQNWAIGCVATNLVGNGYWESKNQPVLPRSLYRAQLEERIGKKTADMVLASTQE